MATLEQTIGYIKEQNTKRDLWIDNDSPEEVAKMIRMEAEELEKSIQEAMITDNVFEVASEIGDVGYLLLRLCDSLGIDLLQAVEMKIIRNSYKYPDHIMSNGRNYEQAADVSKKAWRAMGGDAGFSHAYLNFLTNDDDEEYDKYPKDIFAQSN